MEKCENCQNHQIITVDTNTLILLANYCLEIVSTSDYDGFCKEFFFLIKKIRNCSVDRKLHIPRFVFETEVSLLRRNSAFRYKKVKIMSKKYPTSQIRLQERFSKILSGGKRKNDEVDKFDNLLRENLTIDNVNPTFKTKLATSEKELSDQDKEIIALSIQLMESNDDEKVWIFSDDEDMKEYVTLELEKPICKNIIIAVLPTFLQKLYECCEVSFDVYHSFFDTLVNTTFVGDHYQEMGFYKQKKKAKYVGISMKYMHESTVRKLKKEMQAQAAG